MQRNSHRWLDGWLARGLFEPAIQLSSKLALVLVLAASAQAADRYVRQGAIGNGSGSDWTNAYTSLPATLIRGDTYYIAGGVYPARTFSTPLSGGQVITLKGATIASHGTSVGWSDSYAVSANQARFGPMTFLSGHWVVDGSVGSMTEDQNAYGFRIDNSAACSHPFTGIVMGNGSATEFSNMTFKHILFKNCTGDIWSDAIKPHSQAGRWINSTISDCLFDNWQGAVSFNGASDNSDILIERNYFLNGHSSAFAHGEQINANGANAVNLVLRYNVFKDNNGTGTVVANNSDIIGAKIYGNVFVRDQVGNGIISGTSGVGDLINSEIYNNTFVSKVSGGPWVNGDGGTGNIARNNLLFGMNAGIGSGVSNDFNAYFQTTGTPSESNRQVSSANPFVNSSAGDYHLAAATLPGDPLPATFQMDMDGRFRGSDGIWDRGAFEFNSGPLPPSSACDLNGDSTTNVSDVQLCANQAIGVAACGTGDINRDGSCNVVDVQRVVNAALGGTCVTQ